MTTATNPHAKMPLIHLEISELIKEISSYEKDDLTNPVVFERIQKLSARLHSLSLSYRTLLQSSRGG